MTSEQRRVAVTLPVAWALHDLACETGSRSQAEHDALMNLSEKLDFHETGRHDSGPFQRCAEETLTDIFDEDARGAVRRRRDRGDRR